MLFFIIMVVIGILFLILFSVLLINGNKIKIRNLKIKEAEKNVSELLKQKYDLLCSVNSIMKNKGKEDFLKDLETLEVSKYNNIALNRELAKFDKIIVELTDYNKEIVFDDTEEIVFENLEKTNIDRLAVEKYYNDNVTVYNKLIDRFPSNIISKFKDYDEKELFSNEKEEIFEILKK